MRYQVADVVETGDAQTIIQGAKVGGMDEFSGPNTVIEVDLDD